MTLMKYTKRETKSVAHVELKLSSDHKKPYIYLWTDINEIKILTSEYMFNH